MTGVGEARIRNMKAPGLIRPAALMILGLAAIAFALWSLASSADRWQAVCALTFSPDSQTLAAGTFNGKHFNENFHWCIGDLVQTVALFDSETGSRRVVIDESHHPGTSWGLPSTPLGQFLC